MNLKDLITLVPMPWHICDTQDIVYSAVPLSVDDSRVWAKLQ